MGRSSRHKSHKQSKHSSREDREHSGSGEDAKMKERNGEDVASARASRDAYSGEKRKLASQSGNGKDSSGCGNGDALVEHATSKRRKDRADVAGSDRWNGGSGERGDGVIVDKVVKEEGSRLDSEKSLKSKSSADLKSKPSRRHDNASEEKDEIAGEKEKSEGAKTNSRLKLDKDLSWKEVRQYKNLKDKERGSERDRKVQDVKRDMETRGADSEVKKKQGLQLLDSGEERQLKIGIENAEWLLQNDIQNPESEKELEKGIRRTTDGSSNRDKYQDDSRDYDERRLSSRDRHGKDGRYRDERHKDVRYRDKYKEDVDRENRSRDGKRREDVYRERRHWDEKYSDELVPRNHSNDKFDSKHTRGESDTAESQHKKLRMQNHDGSPIYDDRNTKCKDDKENRRFSDRESPSDLNSRSTKGQRSDAEKKSGVGKLESDADGGRSQSCHVDLDSTAHHSRQRSSPRSSSQDAKDQCRRSKVAESKCRDSGSENRVCQNVISTGEVARVYGVLGNVSASRSMEKSVPKVDNHLIELFDDRCQNSETRVSPMPLVDKSPSSSIVRRHLNRVGVRRSTNIEDSRQRSGGSKDARDFSGNECRGGRDLHLDAHSGDELSQADGDSLSGSSPFSRNHLPSNLISLVPPTHMFRPGVDSPSVLFGSSEEDFRGKSNICNRRNGDSGMGRAQGNAWKGIPNWSSPVAHGFIPFQHGPPGGFHPMMQQFPAPPMFGVRPLMELNHTGVPYHVPDADRFSSHARPYGWRNPVDDSCPPLHAWDANNGVLDWDHSRNMMNSRGWETNVDMWKEQNGVDAILELPSAASQKGDCSMPASGDADFNQTESADVEKDSSGASETLSEKAQTISKISRGDEVPLWRVYLSKLDISSDLTDPELLIRCSSLMDVEQSRTDVEDDPQFSCAEEKIEASMKISNDSMSASLFVALNDDSVFQRAVSLYNKQRQVLRSIIPRPSMNGAKTFFTDAKSLESSQKDVPMSIPVGNQEKPGELTPTSDLETAMGVGCKQDDEKEMFVASNELEVPPAVYGKEDERDPANSSENSPSSTNEVKMEVTQVLHQETSLDAVEGKISPGGNHPPSDIEEHTKLVDTVCGPFLFPDVSSEACEAVMPESIESGLVSLSRIHRPQSTH